MKFENNSPIIIYVYFYRLKKCVGYSHLFEATTVTKSTTTNARQLRVLGDGDGGEAATARESKFTNARHAFGESDGGKGATVFESSVPYSILIPLKILRQFNHITRSLISQ